MRRILFCILLILLVSLNSLFAVKPSGSSNFNFGELLCEVGDPSSYTLVCLDSSLIPASDKTGNLTKKKEFNPVKHWLRKSILTTLEEENDPSKQWHIDQPNAPAENPYYIVSLYQQAHIPASEHLTTRLRPGVQEREINKEAYEYHASMIVFPQSNARYALVYLLGSWQQIVNPYAIIPDWGLRLAASQVIFSDRNIKQILGKNNFDPNPTTRKEKKQRLAPLETFALEVGTEGLRTLTILPTYAIGTDCQRLVEGSNAYRFFLPVAEEATQGHTISSLYKMAVYLFGVYRNHPAIHPKLQAYVDEQEIRPDVLKILNERLVAILGSDEAKTVVFPADSLWKTYGTTPLFSYNSRERRKYLLEVLEGQKFTLESFVSIKKRGAKEQQQEPLGRFIYSLPISIDTTQESEEFYRFDCGQWFKVAPSRFEAIIRKMRSPTIKVTMDALLTYTLEDAQGTEEEVETLYQEARYNRRIIANLAGKKQKGILLDRLNIYFEEAGNKFELGDVLLYDEKGQYYIVHIKRKKADDIDHHRVQIERCADYLATELSKKNAQGLLLQGHINSLYINNRIPLTRKRGDYFQKAFAAKKPKANESWEAYLKNTIFKNQKGEASKPANAFKAILRKLDLTFFQDHQDDLIKAVDALYDCHKKTKQSLSEQAIKEFLAGLKQAIEIEDILFLPGVLKEKTRKKITIVMAVIDDRKIEAIREAAKELEKEKNEAEKKGKSKAPVDSSAMEKAKQKLEKAKTKDRCDESEVFKKQQLWGLDSTVQYVQKKGFRFNLVVINENPERPDWDAFGSTRAKVEELSDQELGDDESDEGNSSSKTGSAKKTKSLKKKGDADKDVDPADEEEQLSVTDLWETVKKPAQEREICPGEPGKPDIERRVYKINIDQSQKFTLNGAANPASGIYQEYMSCPTVGDGNCFFHATFTQDGEDQKTMREQAIAMRAAFCNVVPDGGYLSGCRDLVYEEYVEQSARQPKSIPEPMRTMFQKNHDYEIARNYLQKALPDDEQLPEWLVLPHHEDQIKAAISIPVVQAYMERFRQNRGIESFIPARPEGTVCPAERLAHQQNVRINIFMFNKDSGRLRLLKSVGVAGAGENNPIYNILIDDIHYVALINPAESEARQKAVIQIMKNAGYLQ